MPAWPPASLVARLRDILQLRFTPHFSSLPPSSLNSISPANPLRRLAKVVGYAAVRLAGNVFQPIRNPDKLDHNVWLYVVSQNNYESLHFIRENRPDTVLVAGQSKQIGRYNRLVNRVSLRTKLLHYWQFPFVFLGLLRSEGGKAWRFFDLIFNAIGYYEVYCRALRYHRPRAVVFANDHNDDARALLLACLAEGVPTAYVQHASVSTSFPPLGFDLSLLEGQDAFDKYRQCGPIRGRVELVGMPKADAFVRRRNERTTIRHVGIAINPLDPTDSVVLTIEYLLHVCPVFTFTLRPHPSDTRKFSDFCQRYPRLSLSNAQQENVFEFLSHHDALIAGDTSTHLEATLLNLVSIYYRFGAHNVAEDYYGYAANYLVDRAFSLEHLAALLTNYADKKPASHYLRAAYYCATLSTPFEGHSQALALDHLNAWLSKF